MGDGYILNLSLLREVSQSLCVFKVGEHFLEVYRKLGKKINNHIGNYDFILLAFYSIFKIENRLINDGVMTFIR